MSEIPVAGVPASRLDGLTSWHADWTNLRVAVLGLGVTGFAAADTLAELGADVLVVASGGPDERAQLLNVLGVALVQSDLSEVPAELAAHQADLVIVSPGFHPDHVLLNWARAQGIAVWGDIELAWRLRNKMGVPAEWLLVTGTNGKTTTVQLAATMLASAGYRVAPCGNIGVPVLDAIRDPQGWDVLVVELSSYQLHHLPRTGPGALQPWSSVCLNVADDHLDWHGSAEAYREAKATVYFNTGVACIYNKADAATLRMVENAEVREGARAIGFGLGVPGPSELGIVEGILCDRAFLDDRFEQALELATLTELAGAGLSAPHVVADVLAASALARSFGVDPETVRSALVTFHLDAHRIEVVALHEGIHWIDDSKATNPHAADASLASFDSVVWLVGGLLKGVNVDELVRKHASRLRGAVIIGVDRLALRDAFARHAPLVPVFEVESDDTEQVMPGAVRLAASVARAGDVVLLAPAAASMDQFNSYAERGKAFNQAVHQFLGR
ncbi:UDP-N-acetylmuramoyl-L-alanine--D-glutamate ligase [Cryobacterium psychrophilum]|uniref:UDP-N-acetylmuramoylalanine--D-glutamate ligase n=1 Tax=Cryobacterium psychrophilum TaxID=41988 RepID=A0A4Y8KU08_9MICO|nr:UDP-N-acetylmuramoyl-L-alanine--D-glutamate ligase [Cryobacterium psychrophilum]TDW31490.1 UDP-N-acetylmuramoylalanine--D-glutamate ligase [Cryobacterium psychrophilum]TFD78920.1 UDP-N-acetylmuramoyl-L-alanine--D-glutamate ligase [Cryobacterium psychrophilum]